MAQSERVLSGRCAMAESSEVIYEAVEQRINVLAARTDYPCRHLVIMGGVLINSDFDAGSFCSVRRLIRIDLATRHEEDWLPALLQEGPRLHAPRSQ